MKTFTISELARQCGLSRSTLLYYSKIGLLQPIDRTESNYRLYGEQELGRLRKICTLRRTGLALKEIIILLDADRSTTIEALHKRLRRIGDEIEQLKIQRDIILKIANHPEIQSANLNRLMSREKWSDILRAAGLDENGMHRWHHEFENSAPEAHRQFLESLGIKASDITRIRAWSLAWEPVTPAGRD